MLLKPPRLTLPPPNEWPPPEKPRPPPPPPPWPPPRWAYTPPANPKLRTNRIKVRIIGFPLSYRVPPLVPGFHQVTRQLCLHRGQFFQTLPGRLLHVRMQ